MIWNPSQYERFRDERAQPFRDLMAMLERTPRMRVLDLGCGTGELTAELHRSLGALETTGVDTSPAMLERAKQIEAGGVHFEPGDLSSFGTAQSYDLVFSNAALHWVPNHVQQIARLTGLLRDGGQLALQVPANFDQPSHVIAAEVAAEPRFRAALGGYVKPVHVLEPVAYAVALHELGYRRQHVRLQIYPHLLQSAEDVVEWMRGTTLTDYEARMPADAYRRFVDAYRTRLLSLLPGESPLFFPFKRILVWAMR